MSDQLLSKIENRICLITINRPEKRNSLNNEILQELSTLMEKLKTEEEARVVVIRGAGEKAFCAGYDIGQIPTSRAGGRPADRNCWKNALTPSIAFPTR